MCDFDGHVWDNEEDMLDPFKESDSCWKSLPPSDDVGSCGGGACWDLDDQYSVPSFGVSLPRMMMMPPTPPTDTPTPAPTVAPPPTRLTTATQPPDPPQKALQHPAQIGRWSSSSSSSPLMPQQQQQQQHPNDERVLKRVLKRKEVQSSKHDDSDEEYDDEDEGNDAKNKKKSKNAKKEKKEPKSKRLKGLFVAPLPTSPSCAQDSVFAYGQALQGSHKHGVVISLKPHDVETFFGYSLNGSFLRIAYTLMRPLCNRYVSTFEAHNKFEPNPNYVWSVATKYSKEEPMTARENAFINDITMRKLWCGSVQNEVRGFVFIVHSAHGYYCFPIGSPNPQRLLLSWKLRPTIRLQVS